VGIAIECDSRSHRGSGGIISLLIKVIILEIEKFSLHYLVSASAFVKTPDAKSAYLPDMLVINPQTTDYFRM
jgi:hypothetical protein